jgi:hypothetical protein
MYGAMANSVGGFHKVGFVKKRFKQPAKETKEINSV